MSTLTERIAADVLEAQKLTRKYFVTELDLSEASIDELEAQFDAVGYSLKGGKSPENIQLLKRVWGSYLGETIRKQLGGEWGLESSGDGEQLVLNCPSGKVYPHEQVSKRLQGDSSQSISTYFKSLKS